MKNMFKWLLILLLLVGIIGGSTVLYNRLSKDYKENNNSKVTSGENTADNEALAVPDFTMLDYNGKEVNLSDFKGKPIVLNFWATWCYYCKEEMPEFDKAAKEYPDVQFIMLNVTDGLRETEESARKYIEDNGYEFDVFFDIYMEGVNDYYIPSYPTTIFIDSEGELAAKQIGALDYDRLIAGIESIT